MAGDNIGGLSGGNIILASGWSGKPKGPNITTTTRAQSNDTSTFSAAYNIGSCFFWPMFLPAIDR